MAAETLARLVRDWDRVGEMAAPGAYAHRTAVNLANSWFRRRAAYRRAVARRGPVEDVHSDPDSAELLVVREAVANLPPQQRAAVALHHMAGFTTAEVAEQLGVAPGTVRSNLHHAREALRATLGGDVELAPVAVRPALSTDVVLERATTLRRRRTAAAIVALVLGLGAAVGIVTQNLSRPETPIIAPEPGDAPVWQSLPEAPVATRLDPLVAGLDDGRLVVVGGLVRRPDDSVVFATDGAILNTERSGWQAVPPVPIELAEERGVTFAVSGGMLWARQLGPTGGFEGAPGAEGLGLARLDLSDAESGWVTLPALDLGRATPTVAVVGEQVVALLGEQAESSGQSGLTPFITSGAVWRDGAWTRFDAAPTPTVASPFIGLDGNHLAVVGGLTVDGATAEAAVLDLATGTWTSAPDHPTGPRAHLRAGVNSLVVDGRLLAAGGVSEPGNGEERQYAEDAAWLDFDSLTWETLDLPYPTVAFAPSPSTQDMVPPIEMQLTPRGQTNDTADLVRIDEHGQLVPAVTGPLDFDARTIRYVDGEPVLAVSDDPGPEADVRAALATSEGQWIEVTLDERRAGVTYTLLENRLLAVGGVAYATPATDDGNGTATERGPLIIRQLTD